MGKTHGDRNTKIMALTDARGLPVKLALTGGEGRPTRAIMSSSCSAIRAV